MEIDLVIVNYFSSGMIDDLLDGVDRSDFRKIVLVDNSDNNAELIRLETVAVRHEAMVLPMEENVGFGAAVNRGVDFANPNPDGIIWILNPDTKPESNAGPRLAHLMNESGVDLISPLILTGASADEVWFGGGELDLKYGRTKHRLTVGVTEDISFITGAALMAKAESWRSLGGFREDLFMYWEDADLSIRAARAGMRLGIEPRVCVWHAVGATSHSAAGRSSLFHFYMQRNRVLVLWESYGLWYLFGLPRMVEAAKMVRRALIETTQPVMKARASILGLFAGGIEARRRAVGRTRSKCSQ